MADYPERAVEAIQDAVGNAYTAGRNGWSRGSLVAMADRPLLMLDEVAKGAREDERAKLREALEKVAVELDAEADACERWATKAPEEKGGFDAQRDGYRDSAHRLRHALATLNQQQEDIQGQGDPDYSPAYQDEYQRLWHEAVRERKGLAEAIAAELERIGTMSTTITLRECWNRAADVARRFKPEPTQQGQGGERS